MGKQWTVSEEYKPGDTERARQDCFIKLARIVPHGRPLRLSVNDELVLDEWGEIRNKRKVTVEAVEIEEVYG